MIKFQTIQKYERLSNFNPRLHFVTPRLALFASFSRSFSDGFIVSLSTSPLCLGWRLNLDRGIGRLRSGAGLF
jgi:hypothetical protein